MHEGKVFRKQRKILDSDFPTSVQVISPHSYYGMAICVDLHHRLHSVDVRRANAFLKVEDPSYEINGIGRILAELERNCPKCVLLRCVATFTKTGPLYHHRAGGSPLMRFCQQDFAGPVEIFSLTQGDRRVTKGWVSVVACESTGFASLQLIPDYSASSANSHIQIINSTLSKVYSVSSDYGSHFRGNMRITKTDTLAGLRSATRALNEGEKQDQDLNRK